MTWGGSQGGECRVSHVVQIIRWENVASQKWVGLTGWHASKITALWMCVLSCVWLFATPWTVALQGVFQARILGCPFLLQGIFLAQGSNPHLLCFLRWQADSLSPVPPGKPKITASSKSNRWERGMVRGWGYNPKNETDGELRLLDHISNILSSPSSSFWENYKLSPFRGMRQWYGRSLNSYHVNVNR